MVWTDPRQAANELCALVHDHRVKHHHAAHQGGAGLSGIEGDGRAHRMARQHDGLKARLFGQGIENGNIVIAMIIPRPAPLDLCGQGRLAMAALIDPADPDDPIARQQQPAVRELLRPRPHW